MEHLKKNPNHQFKNNLSVLRNRKYPRITMDSPCEIVLINRENKIIIAQSRIIDLSMGGLAFQSNTTFKVGDSLTVIFRLHLNREEVEGIVLRSHGKQSSIKFISVSPGFENQISKFIFESLLRK